MKYCWTQQVKFVNAFGKAVIKFDGKNEEQNSLMENGSGEKEEEEEHLN